MVEFAMVVRFDVCESGFRVGGQDDDEDGLALMEASSFIYYRRRRSAYLDRAWGCRPVLLWRGLCLSAASAHHYYLDFLRLDQVSL